MSNQPTTGMGGMLPGVAAAAGLRRSDDDETRSSDQGVPVGEADREADMERSGAGGDEDTSMTAPRAAFMSDLGVENAGSDDEVPVGAADAEADRERTTEE